MFRMAAGCLAIAVLGCDAAAETLDATIAEKKAEVLEEHAVVGTTPPPTSSVTIKKPEAQAVDPAGDKPLDDAITCLARTIYWEARSEPPTCMEAIANVVMNRLGHNGFPSTVCAVVKQGHEKGACQFSWRCDGRPDSAREDDAYTKAKEVARRALNLQLPDRTGGALYFYLRSAPPPSWAQQYIKTVDVDGFSFYRPPDGAAH